ncbi:hypothetical protein Ngar_c15800 [Candidatus Nitrososphaera gargensis Ga9.2]|uniref:Uncharacterized protein n=1 Tax=Nitrososphaera gargensis (strain Ga9.2) TaxID=1237085 RepID=K0IHU3_NITGG|nr:hypothetical protein [Candidatus Nitrososphaera gargensis]AFU58513.1 hypothetical protein Ngar_c15800 [Candidatus Nitrososphaera gargensis Ga9.2]
MIDWQRFNRQSGSRRQSITGSLQRVKRFARNARLLFFLMQSMECAPYAGSNVSRKIGVIRGGMDAIE